MALQGYPTTLPRFPNLLPSYSNGNFGMVRPGTSQRVFPQPNQSIQYNGLAPAYGNPDPGILTSDMLSQQFDANGNPIRGAYSDRLAEGAGYRGGNIPQGIPGTNTNYTWQNPPPGRSATPGAPAGGTPPVTANPWFQAPWQQQKQNEQPYWMKSFPAYGRS